MTPLTEGQLRGCLVNASRREAAEATLPDLGALPWEDLEYVGWRDRRAPLSAYVVLELDGGPAGVLLRAAARGAGPRRAAVCAWCHDVVATDVSLYVARRAGSSGRAGNTLGTLVCTGFTCPANVRRPPTALEGGAAVPAVRERVRAERVAGLVERSSRFVREIARTR